VLQYDPADPIVGILWFNLLYAPFICGDGMRTARVASVPEAAVPSLDEILGGHGASAAGRDPRG
jgi:hypothetical protein